MTGERKRILISALSALLITVVYAVIIHFGGLIVGFLVYVFTSFAVGFYDEWEQ